LISVAVTPGASAAIAESGSPASNSAAVVALRTDRLSIGRLLDMFLGRRIGGILDHVFDQ
jgi:hypothetical protein